MLAKRITEVHDSVTLALTARARALKAGGRDVIAFTAGELDSPPPAELRRGVQEALERGDFRYTDSSGRPELRAAIAAKLERDQGLAYEARDVLVSCGAKHSIYNLLQVLCDPGTEVLIPSPYWLSYPEMARLAGAVPVAVETREESGFLLEPPALERAITARARVLIVNSPGNPTGAVYGRDVLEGIAAVVRRHPAITVISDEIYEKIVYDGERHTSILEVAPDLRDRTVIVNGMSKSLAVTGLRLGFAAGPREVIAAAGRLQSHSTSNPTSIVQAGALAAIGVIDDYMRGVVADLGARRRTMVDRLAALPGMSVVAPRGAFYCFPKMAGLIGRRIAGREIDGAAALCEAALEGADVVLIPGESFGSGRHVRLSFAMARVDIERGLDRLARLLGSGS